MKEAIEEMPTQQTVTAAVRRKLKAIERHKKEAARLIDEVELDLGIDKVVDEDRWYFGSHVDEQRTMDVAEMEKLLELFLALKGAKSE